jgi:hypothetical protein
MEFKNHSIFRGGRGSLEVIEVTMESKRLTLALRIEELTLSLRGVIIISLECQRSPIALR